LRFVYFLFAVTIVRLFVRPKATSPENFLEKAPETGFINTSVPERKSRKSSKIVCKITLKRYKHVIKM